jgi:hypothetical protein
MRIGRWACVLGIAVHSSLAAAQLPPSGGTSIVVSPEARRHFNLGVAFIRDPDGARYDDAYREFAEAYRISPSWKILGNLALCALKIERNGEAIEAYERYVAEGGKEIDDVERTQVLKDVALLRASSGTVDVGISPATEATLTDQRSRSSGQVNNIYKIGAPGRLSLVVQAGHHVFTVSVAGKEQRWEIDVVAGGSAEHTFRAAEMKPAIAPAAPASSPAEGSTSSPLRTAGIVVGAVGGLSLLGGVVTGLMAKSKLSSVEGACVADHCPPAKKSDADAAESLATTTNVLWIGGGVLLGAGAAMYLLGKPRSTSARVDVVPAIGSGFQGVAAQGAF